MSRSKKFPRPYRRPSATPHVPTAVSVIIPLYNAERYIADALDSLLAQTFQKFEVIVVDDCSTDNSREIVEGYRERFGGRLTLAHMKKNSGLPSLPRNKGLILSRGEYVFFMDNDDVLTKTALEEMYTLAKNYDADFVYCERYYEVDVNLKNARLKLSNYNSQTVDKPTLEPDSLQERLNKDFRGFYSVFPWLKLLRREFLTDNEIFFPNIIRDDSLWTWQIIFCAKKILRIPNAVYLWRNVETSITRTEKTPQETITFWISPVLFGLKTLDDIMDDFEFFRQNPKVRYAMLERFINDSFFALLDSSFRMQSPAVYETIRHKFGDRLGEYDVLIPALTTAINTQMKINLTNHRQYQQFAAKAQARIAELEAQVKRLQS